MGELAFRGRVSAPPDNSAQQAKGPRSPNIGDGDGWLDRSVRDLGGGELDCSFNVPRAGTFLMHVSLEGAHVGGSPLVLRVAPGACDPTRCVVHGEAQVG